MWRLYRRPHTQVTSWQAAARSFILPTRYCRQKHRRPAVLSSTTYDITRAAQRLQSPSSADDRVVLPPLRCPGGPRMKSEGLKHLFRVPHAGYLAKYGHRFMLNLKLTHQVASKLSQTTLRTPGKVLLELGPGCGALTRSLLTRPCYGVLGVESDARFNPHMEQIRSYTRGKFRWVNADVMRSDEVELLRAAFPTFVERHLRRPPQAGAAAAHDEGPALRSAAQQRILHERRQRRGRPATAEDDAGHGTSPSPALDLHHHWWADGEAMVEVIANLPFNIITDLLMRYAVDCSRRSGVFRFGRVPLHVFTQKEVAERVVAAAGSMHFSRLSVLCQSYFRVRLQHTFTEATYYPRTEVLGAMITLEPRTQPLMDGLDAASLIHFTNLVMRPGSRGHTVHKALSKVIPPEVVQYMLQEVHTDGAVTVLDLTVEEITKLAMMWQNYLLASQQAQSL